MKVYKLGKQEGRSRYTSIVYGNNSGTIQQSTVQRERLQEDYKSHLLAGN